MTRLLQALAVLAAIAGCGNDQIPAPSEPKTITIKAADFGNDWPLLVSEAKLGCVPPSAAYVEIGGRQCALNGKALSIGMERCDDASKTGNAVAFGMFIQPARALCPAKG